MISAGGGVSLFFFLFSFFFEVTIGLIAEDGQPGSRRRGKSRW